MKLVDISEWCTKGHELSNYPEIGEVEDGTFEFGDLLEVNGTYYAARVHEIRTNTLGVREIEYNPDGEETSYESNLKCPYCGYEDEDSWELSDDDEEHSCGRCHGTIAFERIVTVEYSATPVTPPTIQKMNWAECK